jgi:hypothetical protein
MRISGNLRLSPDAENIRPRLGEEGDGTEERDSSSEKGSAGLCLLCERRTCRLSGEILIGRCGLFLLVWSFVLCPLKLPLDDQCILFHCQKRIPFLFEVIAK